MRMLLATLALLSAAARAQAEGLTLYRAEYEPTQISHDGRLDECGLTFSAVATAVDRRAFGIAGSMYGAYWPDKVPYLAAKVTIGEVRDGDIVPLRVLSATFRVGKMDTGPMRAFQSPDGHSLLLQADVVSQPELAAAFPERLTDGAWLSFSLGPHGSDYDVRLRPFGNEDKDTFDQYSQCSQIASERYVRELRARMRNQKR